MSCKITKVLRGGLCMTQTSKKSEKNLNPVLPKAQNFGLFLLFTLGQFCNRIISILPLQCFAPVSFPMPLSPSQLETPLFPWLAVIPSYGCHRFRTGLFTNAGCITGE